MKKNPFTSKTAIVGLITAVAGVVSFFNPDVATFINAHAQEIVTFGGVVIVALRRITSGKMTFTGK